MYNNPYVPNYNVNMGQQSLNDRIDNQIAQLNQMKEQIKNNQHPAINQTFQLAPSNNHQMRYANTIDDVSKEIIYGDTPFFSKDMSVLWVKNTKGSIKTYELNEIVPKDEKDMRIEYLMAQIDELKGMIKNEQLNTNDTRSKVTTDTEESNDTDGESIESKKSTSVQRISKGKK